MTATYCQLLPRQPVTNCRHTPPSLGGGSGSDSGRGRSCTPYLHPGSAKMMRATISGMGLRQAAEYEEPVRLAVATWVATGASPNIKKAVKQVVVAFGAAWSSVCNPLARARFTPHGQRFCTEQRSVNAQIGVR